MSIFTREKDRYGARERAESGKSRSPDSGWSALSLKATAAEGLSAPILGAARSLLELDDVGAPPPLVATSTLVTLARWACGRYRQQSCLPYLVRT